MRMLLLLLAAAPVIFLSSCGSQKKSINNYIQNLTDTSGVDSSVLADPVIQKNDLLSIRVYSASIHPDVDAPYNLEGGTSGTSGGSGAGFLVNSSGNIDYPRLGLLHAEGLTKEQLADIIRQKLEGQLTNPSVIIRFLNYRITILGEVHSPGTFTIQTERVTILEALGLAGDVTDFGKKSTVKILRENNGRREVGMIDLTSKELFNSKFYRLEQNDVVFVEQTRQKIVQQDKQELTQNISIVASLITAVALIISITK
jgi:polysaccharide export outer membrane protein